MVYTVSRILFLLLCKILLRIKAYGRENVPKKGAFILACNHVSYLDPAAVGVVCPRKLVFLAREDLFFNRFFGWWFVACGVIPLKRGSADLSAMKKAMQCLKSGCALAMFPEGSRKGDNQPDKPYGGVAFLAAKLNLPVVPVFIAGTEEALPKGAKYLKCAKVSVHFGKQIFVERRVPYQDSAGLIMAKIKDLSCLNR